MNSYFFRTFIGGLSKFARIAKSVTRNRSLLMNFGVQNSKTIHIDPSKPSQLPNVCISTLSQHDFLPVMTIDL